MFIACTYRVKIAVTGIVEDIDGAETGFRIIGNIVARIIITSTETDRPQILPVGADSREEYVALPFALQRKRAQINGIKIPSCNERRMIIPDHSLRQRVSFFSTADSVSVVER